MADKDVKIKVTLEGKDAERGLTDITKALKSVDDSTKSAKVSFTEINQAFELAGKGIALVSSAYSSFASILNQGKDVYDIKLAFKDLQEQAGQTADQGLEKLRKATAGLLSDFELAKQANAASTFGLTPEQFETIADAANKLGGSVGKSLPEALNILTTAAGRGSDKLLQQLKITVDLSEADKKYRDTLNETGQRLFDRAKIIDTVVEATHRLTEADDTATDASTRFQVVIKNFTDAASESLVKNKDLTQALDEMGKSLSGINGEKLIELLNNIITLGAKAASALVHLRENFGFLVNAKGIISEQIFGDLKKEIQDLNTSADLGKFVQRTRDDVDSYQKKLDEIKAKGGIAGAFGIESDEEKVLQGRITGLRQAFVEASEKQRELIETQLNGTEVTKKAAQATDEASEATKRGTQNLDQYKKLNEEAAKKLHDLTVEFSKLSYEIENKGIAQSLDAGLDKLSDVDFQKLKEKLLDNATEAFKLSLDKYEEAHLNTDEVIAKNRENLERELDDKRLAAQLEIQKKADDEQKRAYEESITFWRSTFENAITGVSFNLKDALKQVAVGFAADAANALFGNISGGIKSPQDLGGVIFQSIFGSSGSAGGIGSFLSTGASLASGASLFGNLGALSTGIEAGVSGAFAPGAFGAAGASAAGYGAASTGASIGSFLAGNSALGVAGPIGLGLGASILIADQLGAFDSGTTNKETQARRDFRTSLQSTGLGQNLEFQGVKGITSLFSSDYSLGSKNQFTGDAVGLANPLAQVLAGGDDKLASDIAGIFADATDNADSFNEVLVNTLSLMDKMGVNAEEQKDSLAQLFLDGKVSLEEFSAGLSSLNILAQDNLVGKGSVAEAMKIVAENIESGPATALKGFELALKEAAELGITSMSGLGAYLSDRLGPQGVAVFDRLQAAGITSFEDIQNASADQVALIFNELTGIQGLLTDVFSATASKAADAFSDSAAKISRAAKSLREDISSINKELNDTKSRASELDRSQNGRDPNEPLGQR